MRVQSLQLAHGGFTITAESDEEKAMLNLTVAALEMVFPNMKDRARPAPSLLVLQALQIHASRMGLAQNEDS